VPISWPSLSPPIGLGYTSRGPAILSRFCNALAENGRTFSPDKLNLEMHGITP
jgi:hypothetical protein